MAVVAQKPNTSLCASCHGTQGISMTEQWPNIAGQHRDYLSKQLKDMISNKRDSPIMAGIVTTLSAQDIDALAAYYAELPLPKGAVSKQDVQRGEQLYRSGDFNKHIPACIACHGPKGTGNAQAGFPVLAGQHAAYTIAQLLAFKKQTRHNDLNHIMQDISQKMDERDMEAVARYIEGL